MTNTENTFPTITVTGIPDAMRHAHKFQRTPFFISNPGIGKTECIGRFAGTISANMIVLVASMLDRCDFVLPLLNRDTGLVDMVPLAEMALLSREKNPNGGAVVLYWNEYNCAPETLHPVLYRIINERRLGGLTLRDNVLQVADGNPTVASSASRELPAPAKRRFSWYQVRASHEDWLNWAAAEGVDARITAFISAHPALLSTFDPADYETITFASPAGYARLAVGLDDILSEMPAAMRLAAICADIGQSAGYQLHAFLAHMDKLAGFEKFFAAPDRVPLPEERDVLYLLCGVAAQKARHERRSISVATTLAERLMDVHREHSIYLWRNLLRNPLIEQEDVMACRGFDLLVELASSDDDLAAAIFQKRKIAS